MFTLLQIANTSMHLIHIIKHQNFPFILFCSNTTSCSYSSDCVGNSVTGGDGLASETKGSKSGSGSSGAAIGGVIGGVIAIIIIIIILLLIICYTRRVKKRKAHPPDGRILPNGNVTILYCLPVP